MKLEDIQIFLETNDFVINATLGLLEMRFFWDFLIDCEKFLNDRKSVYDIVESNVQKFTNLNNEQKFLYLLTSENIPVLNAVGKFILNNICN